MFTLALTLAALGPTADPAKKPDDLAALQGRWVLMSWQDDGYDATFGGKGPAEITITDSLFRYQVFGGGRMHDDERITLDTTKEPKRFSLLREKQIHPLFKDADGTALPYRGAYRLDGDELRITLNLKSGKAISLALDNSRARPGTKRGDKVDGFEEETDKLYVLMREEGFTAGTRRRRRDSRSARWASRSDRNGPRVQTPANSPAPRSGNGCGSGSRPLNRVRSASISAEARCSNSERSHRTR